MRVESVGARVAGARHHRGANLDMHTCGRARAQGQVADEIARVQRGRRRSRRWGARGETRAVGWGHDVAGRLSSCPCTQPILARVPYLSRTYAHLYRLMCTSLSLLTKRRASRLPPPSPPSSFIPRFSIFMLVVAVGSHPDRLPCLRPPRFLAPGRHASGRPNWTRPLPTAGSAGTFAVGRPSRVDG